MTNEEIQQKMERVNIRLHGPQRTSLIEGATVLAINPKTLIFLDADNCVVQTNLPWELETTTQWTADELEALKKVL